MSFCTPEDVILITNSKPKHFQLEPGDAEGLDDILMEWISESENMITNYCGRNFTEPVPLAVKNVCKRLTANMIAFATLRRDSPIIKVNDFSSKFVGSEIFTDDLKSDLKPFKLKKKVSVFSI